MWDSYDYLLDPHTAVAYAVYHRLRREGKLPRGTHTVIAATAHPYKFPPAMAKALGVAPAENPYDTLRAIAAATGVAIPENLSALEHAPVRFADVIPRENMPDYVAAYRAAIAAETK